MQTAKAGYTKKKRKENLAGWAIVGPIILYYIVFGLIPLFNVFKFSFYTDDLFLGRSFVGLKNFIAIFTKAEYYKPFLATILIAIFTIGISVVFGLFLAKLMTSNIKGKTIYRTVVYLPVVISMAVTAQIVMVWLNFNNGTINNLLEGMGLSRVKWIDSTVWMYFWIIIVCIWKGMGASVILFIAGLMGISQDVQEAADIDGAGKIKKFFYITIPQLKPMITFVMITSIIGAFNIFEPVQLISGGGPNGSTKVILFQIYNEAFQNGNLGMSSAISVIVLLLLMGLTALNMKFGESKE